MPIDASSDPYGGQELDVDLDDAGKGAVGAAGLAADKGIDSLDDPDGDLGSAGKGAAAGDLDLDEVDKSGTKDFGEDVETDDPTAAGQGLGDVLDSPDDDLFDKGALGDEDADVDDPGDFDKGDLDLDVDL